MSNYYTILNEQEELTEAGILDKLKGLLKKGKDKLSQFSMTQGMCLMFKYNAKHYVDNGGNLEFYDKNPFGICIGKSKVRKSHWLILNFNYIPVKDKKRLWKKITSLYPKWETQKILPHFNYKLIQNELKSFESEIGIIIKEYIPNRMSKIKKITPLQFKKTLGIDLGTFAGIPSAKWLWNQINKGKSLSQINTELKQKRIK